MKMAPVHSATAGHLFLRGTDKRPTSLRRGLIAFDLASIPTNATITGATLSMFLSRSGPSSAAVNISLSKALRDWGEGASNAGEPGGMGVTRRSQAMPPGSTPSTTPAFGPLLVATFHPRPARPRQSTA